MKRWHTVIFLFSVIAALAALCLLFPRGGVTVAGMDLDFPSLGEVLGTEELEAQPSDTVSAILPSNAADEEPAVTAATAGTDAQVPTAVVKTASARAEYVPTGPRRVSEAPFFTLPDSCFFDPFFAAMDSARVHPARVLHYGDSQIEIDRITNVLRAELQSRFGGSGPGLLPLRSYNSLSASVSSSGDLERHMSFGPKPEYGTVGPFADYVRLDSTVTVTVSTARRGGQSFSRATVLAGNVEGGLRVSCRGESRNVSGQSVASAVFSLPDSSRSVSLTLSGHADLYGVLLDSDSGVRVDNIAMRGSSGTIFTRMSRAQLEAFNASQNVCMVILQYGGNTVPYMKSGDKVNSYCANVRKQVVRMREAAPDAVVVFIGPSDMSTTINGRRHTYPVLPELVDSLKSAVCASGGAYWDMYSAMGGRDSMAEWAASEPRLAGSDHIHLTQKGADRIGELLSESLLGYYEEYRKRR